MWQHLLEQIYERIRPASLNSTGLMQPKVEWILKLLHQLAQSNGAARRPSSEQNLLPATNSLFQDVVRRLHHTALSCGLPGLESELSIPKVAFTSDVSLCRPQKQPTDIVNLYLSDSANATAPFPPTSGAVSGVPVRREVFRAVGPPGDLQHRALVAQAVGDGAIGAIALAEWDCGGDPGPKRDRKEAACSAPNSEGLQSRPSSDSIIAMQALLRSWGTRRGIRSGPGTRTIWSMGRSGPRSGGGSPSSPRRYGRWPSPGPAAEPLRRSPRSTACRGRRPTSGEGR